jgi:SWI/SNF-related matrix-associated actin-dependent regulator 1 of chromatin subfamily A
MKTIQINLEPTMRLVICPSELDNKLPKLFSNIPHCSYRSANRSWVVNVGRMDPLVVRGIYSQLVTDMKPVFEDAGYAVKFNQPFRNHALALTQMNKLAEEDFTSRVVDEWQHSLSFADVQPYQHQLDAVQFWLEARGRGVLGHEMGTGKTISAILACHAVSLRKIIIFLPAGLKAQWKSEVSRLLPEHGVVDFNGKNYPEEDAQTVVLVSYALAQKLAEQADRYGTKPEAVICDECHYIKSPKALRTKAVIKLAKKVPFFLGLSGTPIINRPVDLYPILNLVAPENFHDWYKFTKKYCNGHQGKFGYVSDGLTNAPALHAELQKVMHRVRKDECLDLPAKTRSVIPLDFFSNKGWVKDYYALRDDIKTGEEHFSALRQFIGHSKLTQSVDWIVDFLDSTEEKLVVFCHHVAVAQTLIAEVNRRAKAKSALKPLAVGFTGETSADARNTALTKFSETKSKFPARVLVSTVGSGGTGLNLQVANQMLIVESTFSVGEMLQAEDRIHRSGQKTPCTIHYVIASGTYDRVLYRLLSSKMDMMNKVVDGDFSKDLNVFDEMMKEI